MQSISLFKCPNNFNINKLRNKHATHKEQVNGQTENLNTDLYVNQNLNTGKTSYKKCVISMDEVIKIRGRVFHKTINELIINRSYDIYINKKNGTLACFANKNSASKIAKFFSNILHLDYQKKEFDLNGIMNNSSDVRRAQFKGLNIQTVSGSALSGNQINNTNLYNIMDQAGNLSTIAVSYPFNNKDVSFLVSSAGSIVLFSNLDNNEVTDFLDTVEAFL